VESSAAGVNPGQTDEDKDTVGSTWLGGFNLLPKSRIKKATKNKQTVGSVIFV
jgi:hypothetical protein